MGGMGMRGWVARRHVVLALGMGMVTGGEMRGRGDVVCFGMGTGASAPFTAPGSTARVFTQASAISGTRNFNRSFSAVHGSTGIRRVMPGNIAWSRRRRRGPRKRDRREEFQSAGLEQFSAGGGAHEAERLLQ